MIAPVNKIIRCSNVDGPGNRTAIFFQSCPFRCLYCHNPETIKMCINCGDCVKTCPVNALSFVDGKVVWNDTKCVDCDTCIKTCKHLASPKIKYMSTDEVLTEIKKQYGFIRGISVSGGECMVHAEFLKELFTKVKALGLTCLIDSNGYFDFKKYDDLLAVSDGVMLDVKAYDNEFHQKLVGQNNNQVIENLKYLLSINKLEEVRTVLLPNHEDQNLKTVEGVSKIIQDKVKYKLLRYRPFGVRQEGIDFIGNVIYKEDDANKLAQRAKELGASKVVVI